ncbi:Putative serine/threonine protein kinase [Kitasatospora sp. MMS16-BH015]|uniref:serine/threonine-protein kinase n=1 Tax=Kitasatospora sp. MMS16-BH015 TaxID=2018025 RepID=UPI000CA39EF3|nr:serine/threonine-protein kinase [Kitasatospora sp. MMS16-BH015]AUG82002.1 Putative serine/threonine protein kinase [Kitasatospora sp. MMS16-BH015]
MNGQTEDEPVAQDGSWTLPGYTHERELGAGASGRVVLARHEATGTRVAVKYLSAAVADTTPFRNEAVLLGGLRSPQVAALYEYVESAEGAAIVMELVDGVALRRLLSQEGATSPEAALAVLKGSLLGLAAAHAAGVVHRDYKPENVLVAADGSSKLVDFGIAVRSGERPGIAGTPVYMAPEQWAGEPASPSGDVYAATATFFECLTGAKPYSGITLAELAVKHTEAPIPDGLAPEAIRPLIRAGLAKTPEERPQSAAALVEELERVACAAYGEDWEERGRRALAALVALLPLLLPSGGGAAAGTTSLATTVLGAGADAASLGASLGVPLAAEAEPARRPRLSRKARLTAGAAGVTLIAGTMAGIAAANSVDDPHLTTVAAPAPELTTSLGPLAPGAGTPSAGSSGSSGSSASPSPSAAAPSSPSSSPSSGATPGGTATPTGSTTPSPAGPPTAGAPAPGHGPVTDPTATAAAPTTPTAPASPSTPVSTPTADPAPSTSSPAPPPPAPLRVISLAISSYDCYGNYGTKAEVDVTTDGANSGTLTLSWIDSDTTRKVVATQRITLAQGQTKASFPVNHTFADSATAWGLQVDTDPAALRGQGSYRQLYAFQCNPPR